MTQFVQQMMRKKQVLFLTRDHSNIALNSYSYRVLGSCYFLTKFYANFLKKGMIVRPWCATSEYSTQRVLQNLMGKSAFGFWFASLSPLHADVSWNRKKCVNKHFLIFQFWASNKIFEELCTVKLTRAHV